MFFDKGSCLALALAGWILAAPAAASTPRSFPAWLQPCELEGQAALCGAWEVFENRATRAGRKIPLRVAVLPAQNPQPAAAPVFYLAGGPGEAATESAAWLSSDLAAVRAGRDVVLVDQRGTGGSNPLDCDFGSAAAEAGNGLFPVEAVRACRDALARRADLTLYTTPLAMEDLDEVRGALGYGRINLLGASYGTKAAQVYLRAHPERVRSVVLIAPVPLDASQLDIARDAQRAIERLFADCAAEPACGAAFPRLSQDFAAVLKRLDAGPVRVEIPDPETSRPVEVTLSSEVFRLILPYRLYSTEAASRVPRSVHLAAGGDFREMARAVLVIRRLVVGGHGRGMYLSVSCAEEPPEALDSEVRRASRGTFIGDLRFRNYREACALWPRAEIPRSFRDPVRSKAPVLILAGEIDPLLPPALGRRIVRHLPQGRLVVVPNASHLPLNACTAGLIRDFLTAGSARGLDTGCVKATRRPAFVLP